MRLIPLLIVSVLFFITLQAQTPAPSAADKQRAQELFAQMRQALGGESKVKALQSLSLEGEHRHLTPGRELKGEIKIELLAPDKFLKSEKTLLQPRLTQTLVQILNGDQIWIDRRHNQPTNRDESVVPVGGGQRSTPVQIANSTRSMSDTVAGSTTIRATPPGAAANERTMLGMQLPTATNGQDRDTSLEMMDEARRVAKAQSTNPIKPPGLEDPAIKAMMERQLRKDFICLALVWLQTSPARIPLELAHRGVIKTEQGNIEALEVTGPEGFAASLFIEQSSHRPVMMSYQEMTNRNAGYVVSSDATDPAALQEIAVQIYFSDYREVQGMSLPFLIIKAINGVKLDEWKIEKYKLNPDLKPKRFNASND